MAAVMMQQIGLKTAVKPAVEIGIKNDPRRVAMAKADLHINVKQRLIVVVIHSAPLSIQLELHKATLGAKGKPPIWGSAAPQALAKRLESLHTTREQGATQVAQGADSS
jgi:hypothetical protein